MRAKGLQPRLIEAKHWDSFTGKDIVDQIMEMPAKKRPTAITCANDSIAMGVLHEFWKRGIKLPDDFSVCGWDDMVGSAYTNPSLTTVKQDFIELAAKTIEALANRLRHDQVVHEIVVPELIIRGSTQKLTS